MPIGDFSCSLEAILFLVGGKWKPLILYRLRDGPLHYGELRRAVGTVSHKMLIQQLKELAADGLVIQNDHGETPPRVEYALTCVGNRLADALSVLGEWGTCHATELEPLIERRSAGTGKSGAARGMA